MSKLALDLDGCFFDFSSSYADLLIEVSGQDLLPEGWRTDPEFPKTWFWERAAGYSPEVEKEVWENHILTNNKFWRELDLLPYAKETLTYLNGLWRKGSEIYFISHRMGEKAKKQTEEALYDHGMDYPCVVFAADKVPYWRLIGTNFFIDDKPLTVIEVARVAKEEKWKNFRLFLQDAPYNREVSGVERAKTVKEALEKAGLWL